jgi:WD40 repeat protein/serine/threonine protein kinase
MMDAKRWKQIKEIYGRAIDLCDEGRESFLAEACAGDANLRREVETLLAAHANAGTFLQAPAVKVAAQEIVADEFTSTAADKFPAALELIGQELANYKIISLLGKGGMGVVYEAEQRHPRRLVALKVIRGGRLVDEFQVKLFLREAQALARLKHPGIAAIYEAGRTDDGQHYFVMELVRGTPLLDYVKGRRLTGAQPPINIRPRLELFLKICEAISYAHQRGVIHRDLKPANILVVDESEEQGLDGQSVSRVEVKILDFGLARITDEDGADASGLSQDGQIKGTLPYMSPEQVRGDPSQIDVRADVYALGVILYELLAERLPYDLKHATPPQAIRIICEEDPKPLSRAWGESRDRESRKSERIDRDVETIALKALEKEPERRYRSAAAMAEDVTRYLTNQPIQARPPSPIYQFRKLVARHKAPFASLAAVFTLLLGFAITMAMQSARIARERDKAVAAERAAAEQRNAAEQASNAEREQRADAEAQRLAAVEQRQLAEEQKVFADEQRARAEQGDETKRQLLYAAQMRLAQQAWDSANIDRMQELLEAQLPQPGQRDLRGFEWYYLWRLAYGDLATLKHTGLIISIVLTPDGTKMASQTLDGDIRIWDTATGKELTPINDGEKNACCMTAISPDGKYFAQSKRNGQIKIFAVSNGAHLSTLEFGQKERSISAFSPDGRFFAATTPDGTVSVWTVSTWKQQVVFKASSTTIPSMVFTPDSQQIVTKEHNGSVKVWDPLNGRELRVMPDKMRVSGMVSMMAFIAGSNNIVIGSPEGGLKIWDFATGEQVAEMKTSQVMALTCSPDGRMIASADIGSVVQLWNARNGTLLTEIKAQSGQITALAFTSDGKGLFTGNWGGMLRFRDIQGVSEAKLLAQNPTPFYNVAFTRDGSRLITTDDAQVIRIHDPHTGRELQKLEGHQRLPLAPDDPVTLVKVAVSPAGGYFATSGYDGTVRTWDEKTGWPLQVFRGHTRALYAIAISPDGRFIASGGSDKIVKVWDAASGRELHTLRGHTSLVSAAAFSPQGKYLVASGEDGTLKVWNYVNGAELFTSRLSTDKLRNLAFSPDGKLLALGGDDRRIILLDTSSWRTVKTLKGHSSWITGVKFSTDGRRLVSSGRDAIRVWELEQGQEVLTLAGHGARNLNVDVAFSPDGASLVTAGTDGKLLLWPAATSREVLARSSAGRRPLRTNAPAE